MALSAGISSGTTYNITAPYATTVNQVKFKGVMMVDNNDSIKTITDSISLKPTTSNWAYINGNGFQFINNTGLNYEVKTIETITVAWIGINHGIKPSNGQYAYAVYPNISASGLLQK